MAPQMICANYFNWCMSTVLNTIKGNRIFYRIIDMRKQILLRVKESYSVTGKMFSTDSVTQKFEYMFGG